MGLLGEALESLAKETFKDKVVYHVNRDSSAINARETVEKKDREKSKKPPEKRGRPPKSKGKQDKQPGEMEKQITQDASDSLEKLNKKCSFGCKKTARGIYRIGKDINYTLM
jgi:hypothetical protein